MTPSVSFANGAVDKTIVIDANSENRTIESAELIVVEESIYSYPKRFYFDNQSQDIKLGEYEVSDIKPDTHYTVSWKVVYSEESDSYTFFDQEVMLGVEFLTLESYQLPEDNELQHTLLEYDVETFSPLEIKYYLGDFESNLTAIFDSPIYINNVVTKKGSTFPINFATNRKL